MQITAYAEAYAEYKAQNYQMTFVITESDRTTGRCLHDLWTRRELRTPPSDYNNFQSADSLLA